MGHPLAPLRTLALFALWCASCLAPAGLELRICGCGSWLAEWLRAPSAERASCAPDAIVRESSESSCCERADATSDVSSAERSATNERNAGSHCDPAHESCACLLIETSESVAQASWLAGAPTGAARAQALVPSERLVHARREPQLAPRDARACESGRAPPGERSLLPLRI